MVSRVRHYILAATALTMTVAGAQDDLRAPLEQTYNAWRQAVVSKDARTWERVTATHRKTEVRNRIVSEKLPFPAAVFDLPTQPPALAGLRFLEAKRVGPTATAAYFGKIDFAVGGKPTDNLLVVSLVAEGGSWLFDKADFVNLEVMKDVRAELAAGNLAYLKQTKELQPSGRVPEAPIAVNPAKYIAKVYVFSPGREVTVRVNKVSRHRFANAKEAEVVIGGAVDGLNEVQYAIKPLPGGTGKEALAIRVYLMSEVKGVQPVKAFEYLVKEGGAVKPAGTSQFDVNAAMVNKLMGRDG